MLTGHVSFCGQSHTSIHLAWVKVLEIDVYGYLPTGAVPLLSTCSPFTFLYTLCIFSLFSSSSQLSILPSPISVRSMWEILAGFWSVSFNWYNLSILKSYEHLNFFYYFLSVWGERDWRSQSPLSCHVTTYCYILSLTCYFRTRRGPQGWSKG